MPSTKVPAFTPSPIVVPLEERPDQELFTLPDLTPILIDEDKKKGTFTISLGRKPIDEEKVTNLARQEDALNKAELRPLVNGTMLEGRRARVSLHGAVNADRAEFSEVWRLDHAGGKEASISYSDFWAILYGRECVRD